MKIRLGSIHMNELKKGFTKEIALQRKEAFR